MLNQIFCSLILRCQPALEHLSETNDQQVRRAFGDFSKDGSLRRARQLAPTTPKGFEGHGRRSWKRSLGDFGKYESLRRGIVL